MMGKKKQAMKRGGKPVVKKRGGGMMEMMGGGSAKKKVVKKRGGGIMGAKKKKAKKQMPTYASTADFDLSIDDIAEEAFERCGLQVRSGYDLKTARRSICLLYTSPSPRDQA